MLQKTNGIVLRSIKYGDTSLITNIFTSSHGVQTYLIQSVRSTKANNNRAAMYQPAMLLDMVVYQQPLKNMQRIREVQPAYIYTSLQEEVVKNSVALFSVELLLRLLPEHAPLPELFDFAFSYFVQLDRLPIFSVANFPLFFIVQCCRILGYELKGEYNETTPHLNMQEGGFTADIPALPPFITDEDTKMLAKILNVQQFDELKNIEMNAAMRFRLLDWYIEFLHRHSQHMGNIKSLTVLQTILH